jgi:hypothetical protein
MPPPVPPSGDEDVEAARRFIEEQAELDAIAQLPHVSTGAPGDYRIFSQ